MKLQKLIYIANGISLAVNDKSLINEPIEAWPYGPVVTAVYHEYKVFGKSKIFSSIYDEDDDDRLIDEAKAAFNDAWKIGKGISAVQLSNWTHKPESPWTKSKNNNLAIIPNGYMKEYFKEFLNK